MERAHVAEENNKEECSNTSKEHVMMAFEENDNPNSKTEEEFLDFFN